MGPNFYQWFLTSWQLLMFCYDDADWSSRNNSWLRISLSNSVLWWLLGIMKGTKWLVKLPKIVMWRFFFVKPNVKLAELMSIKAMLWGLGFFDGNFSESFITVIFFGLVSSSFVALVVSQLSNFFTQDQDCLKEKLKSQTSIWATLLKKYGWSQKHCSKTLTGVQQWRYGKNFFLPKITYTPSTFLVQK